MKRPWCGSPFI